MNHSHKYKDAQLNENVATSDAGLHFDAYLYWEKPAE